MLRVRKLLKGAVAGILLVQFALMLVMSVSGGLHHDLHVDADHADHHCEVTLFNSGALDGVPPPLSAPLPAPALALPEVLPPAGLAAVTATHLLGGVLAQSPPRAP
ncbi:hypothetical protein [Luteolibacter sp. LG18]|uniref:hypothetical protein n=1 Tax=Luteolibacter sp. LG18 TaxID=2819286 RepID=UPI0030C749CC